jgi:hypothetical protein
MSVRELVLPGGLTTLSVNDAHDHAVSIVFTIENRRGQSLTAVIDRAQYHMLSLYLADRLKR